MGRRSFSRTSILCSSLEWGLACRLSHTLDKTTDTPTTQLGELTTVASTRVRRRMADSDNINSSNHSNNLNRNLNHNLARIRLLYIPSHTSTQARSLAIKLRPPRSQGLLKSLSSHLPPM